MVGGFFHVIGVGHGDGCDLRQDGIEVNNVCSFCFFDREKRILSVDFNSGHHT